jgi:hypothetical protein
MVTYPVHKALIYGDGLKSVISFARYSAGDSAFSPLRVKAAFEISQAIPGGEFEAVNVDLATDALDLFRKSTSNATEYEKEWYESGLPTLVAWLREGTAITEGTEIKPVVKELVDSVLDDASEKLDAEESVRLNSMIDSSVPTSTRDDLSSALTSWSERAHTELRDELDIAFHSQRWRKLGWWKLFWRVDDVSMISGEILERRYLVEAEREIIYLAGRLEQSGIVKEAAVQNNAEADFFSMASEEVASSERPSSLAIAQASIDREIAIKEDLVTIPASRPWPLSIQSSRHMLSLTTIPPLQAFAQKLLLQTLSTTSLTATLSGLVYFGTLSTSMFEAGAIAALGLVWSLRRLQKGWEGARAKWEGAVREEGRRSVRQTEAEVGPVIKGQGLVKGPVDGATDRAKVRELIGDIQRLLEEGKR